MFSSIAADHIQNRRNVGPLEGATHYGSSGERGCGPYVEIWLLVEDGLIKRAAYRTHGCPSSIAAASLAAQIATGRKVSQIRLLTGQDLLRILSGLPEGKETFAYMAVEAINLALEEK